MADPLEFRAVPELPEIEVLRRSLEPRLVGQRIERVEVRARKLREPLDRRSLGSLRGSTVVAVRRRAKYLLIDLDVGRTLGIHLGMSGRLTLAGAGEPREAHEHLAFHLSDDRRLRLRDPRRFGTVFVAATDAVADDPHLRHLGREPLNPRISGRDLRDLAAACRGPVKSFLMDGKRLVGVGNIYATEALFQAAIHPRRSVRRISGEVWERLAASVVGVLEEAIRAGGTTLNDFADGTGQAGYFQVSLAVYGRTGEPCPRCGRAIRRRVLAGRSVFYCAGCQH